MFLIFNIDVIIIIRFDIIFANFGKYAISDCPFICLFEIEIIYCQNQCSSTLTKEHN